MIFISLSIYKAFPCLPLEFEESVVSLEFYNHHIIPQANYLWDWKFRKPSTTNAVTKSAKRTVTKINVLWGNHHIEMGYQFSLIKHWLDFHLSQGFGMLYVNTGKENGLWEFSSKKIILHFDIFLDAPRELHSFLSEREKQRKIIIRSDWFTFFGLSDYWVPYLFLCTVKRATVFRHTMYKVI